MDREYLHKDQARNIKLEAIIVGSLTLLMIALAILFGFLARGKPASYWNGNGPVKYSGYNGYGRVDENSQFFNLEKFYANFIGAKSEGNPEEMAKLRQCFTVGVDKDDNLSNDDKVRVTVTIDFDDLNARFPQSKHKRAGRESYVKTYKVHDLEDVVVFDPLAILDEVFVLNDYDSVQYYTPIPRVQLGHYTMVASDNGVYTLVDADGNVVKRNFLVFHSDDDYPHVGERVRITAGNNSKSDARNFGVMLERTAKTYKVRSASDE